MLTDSGTCGRSNTCTVGMEKGGRGVNKGVNKGVGQVLNHSNSDRIQNMPPVTTVARG